MKQMLINAFVSFRTRVLTIPRKIGVLVDPENPTRVERILDRERRAALTGIVESPPTLRDLGVVVDGDDALSHHDS